MKPNFTKRAVIFISLGVFLGAAGLNFNNEKKQLQLGAFSISLTVKNLKASKTFYEKLGFSILGGSEEAHYLIMKNENALIGLFEGMFEKNILTFNPGWDENGEDISAFQDVRQIQKHLEENSITIVSGVDTSSKGPGSIIISDPDGNPILIDQHR